MKLMSRELAVRRIASIVESPQFRHAVTALILLNAIIVGLETYSEVRAASGDALQIADRIILYLFTKRIYEEDVCWMENYA
jgi:voltage-gated sodium channel